MAYVNRPGVDLVAQQLTPLTDRVQVFAGIRNGVTSKQGLARLLQLGAEVFAVDTGARGVIFHPKLYFVRADARASLLIGSANLTTGGLNNNIEAGVQIDLDPALAGDAAFGNGVEERFDGLQGVYPNNVVAVADDAQIDALHLEGRLEDEGARTTKARAATTTPPPPGTVPRIRLQVPVLHATPPVATPAVGPAAHRRPAGAAKWQLVWTSKDLARRDLTIPTGTRTNPTGSIGLDKGRLPAEVDHRHYFRDVVFNALAWTPGNRPGIEEATARFQLVVQGVNHGDFDLVIAHSTSTTNTTYLQRNSTTRLRWGQVRQYVAHERLLGCSLMLYRDTDLATRFLIEID